MGRKPLPPSALAASRRVKLARRLANYVGHENEQVATANKLALLIAANQPFYPAMLYFALGKPLGVALWTFLSTPGFLAVPAVSHRFPKAARALLVLSGIGNTLLCLALYGEDSGVALFLLPCVMIAALSFAAAEEKIKAALILLGLIAFIGTHGRVPGRTVFVEPDDYKALWSVHAYSVAMLVALVSLLFSQSEQRREPSK